MERALTVGGQAVPSHAIERRDRNVQHRLVTVPLREPQRERDGRRERKLRAVTEAAVRDVVFAEQKFPHPALSPRERVYI
jgi:hypothetical protein